MTEQGPQQPLAQRPTEPLPRSFKPAWIFMLMLLLVVVGIAFAAYVVDRAVYS